MNRSRPTDGVMVGSARPDEAWRLATAQRVADAYPTDRPAVIAVAGSVGAGLADRWSDLELDCYWRHAPTDVDRREPIDRLGAEVSGFWEYDADEQEWSEDYRLGKLAATISNFTVAAVDELITAVIERHDTDPVKHMRLAAIQRCQVLRGADIVVKWRRRAAQYPDQLVTAMVEQAVFDTVLALNRVYRPHRAVKWQCALIDGLQIVPDGFATRLDALWQEPRLAGLHLAESLLMETVDLATEHCGANLRDFQESLAARRRPMPVGKRPAEHPARLFGRAIRPVHRLAKSEPTVPCTSACCAEVSMCSLRPAGL